MGAVLNVHDSMQIEVHDVDTSISDSLREQGVHEPNLTSYVRQSVAPGDHVVDVGANIGYFTLLFASLASDDGHVTAFEPDPTNADLLCENIERNDFNDRNVTVVREAVTDEVGTTSLHQHAESSGAHSVDESVVRDGSEIDVRETTVDASLTEPVDFVKIDVEGAEPRVLDGLSDTIQTDRPTLVFELAPPIWSVSPADLLHSLERRDYVFKCTDTNGIHDVDSETLTQFYTDHCEDDEVCWVNVVAEPSNVSSELEQ